MYEEDFVKEKVAPFNIGGRKFEYMPTTGGIENDWLNQYMSIGKDGKPVHDFGMLNKLKMLRITKVPYEPIKVINVDKEWKDLNDDQKWLLLGKLPGDMFDKILTKITNIDKGDTDTKKN